MQSAFKFAMLNHNLNVTSRRFELQAYVDVINTADAFKLSRLSKYCDIVCIKHYIAMIMSLMIMSLMMMTKTRVTVTAA